MGLRKLNNKEKNWTETQQSKASNCDGWFIMNFMLRQQKKGYGLDLGVWERMKQIEKWKAIRKV
jgi:hypothetical protein